MAHVLSSPLALFIIQAIVVIVAARLIGLGARRLGQPMVIAEVLAGVQILLGVASFPFLIAVGWAYVRLAERNEQEFTDLVQRPER